MKFFCISLVAVLSFLLGFGCSPNRVVIDRSFLAEMRRQRGDKSYEIASNNWPELIYLTSTGDEEAIEASIQLIIYLMQSEQWNAVLAVHIDEVARPAYEWDFKVFWRVLSKYDPREQLSVMWYYDRTLPLDWHSERNNYLRSNRKLLDGIDKSFLVELASSCSFELLKQNYQKLLYLTIAGDPDAIDATIGLLGSESFASFPTGILAVFEDWNNYCSDELTKAACEGGKNSVFWSRLSQKPLECQLRVLQYYDRIKDDNWPDWKERRDEYLRQNEALYRMYLERTK